MTLEKMSIMIDPKLRDEFIKEVKKNYDGNLEEGIIDLIKVYVERSKSNPPQRAIHRNIAANVYAGDLGGGPAQIEIEKILLNKTDKDIQDNML